MKKLLLLKLLLFTTYCSFAQTTYDVIYAQNAGYPGTVRPSTSSVSDNTGWTTILPGSAAANAWSPTQTMPFTFSFFGQPVTSYKASANMLLTFDVANTALPSANTNLPAATLPNNTIAGFWDEFTNAQPTGTNDVVHTRVYGTAPNRQLWVVWFSFEYGNPNISYAYNAIVLEETTNKVYVVNLYNAGSPTLTTTVGLQQNSTTAIQQGTNTLPLESNINAVVSEVDYYQFAPRPLVAADASITALLAPVQPACYTATQPIEVTLKNFGTSPISNVPVAARITGGAAPQTITTTYSGTLLPNASVNVTVGNANMLAAGTYNIKAYAALATDGFRGNDTLASVTRTVTSVATLPQTVDFTGYSGTNLATLFPNWREGVGPTLPNGTTSDEWTNSNFGNATGTNGTSARVNIYDLGMNDWIVSPKFLATASSAVRYDLALTAYAATTAATLGSDDQFKVMVSTNCGASWTALRTYSANTPISNTGQSDLVSLSAYAGQEITVGFFVTEGTVNDPEDIDLFLDNIFIGTPPTLDLGVVALVSPLATGCMAASQAVSVSIQNYAALPIDFAVNPATVTVNVTGAVTQTLTTTINTGTLAAGATMNVSMGNLPMSAPGAYTFNSTVNVTGDGLPNNNAAAPATRTVVPVVSLPQNLNFTGYTGSDLTTLFPNWIEKAGATVPTGTSSSWTSSTGLGGSNNTTAKINLWSTGKNEWIVGPKFTPTAQTFFRFKAAITDYNGLTPDANGMDADDKVQVMVSTDCGLTFSPVFTLNAANTATLTNVLTEQAISLAAYAGQNIIVALFATEGTTSGSSDYDFHIDDLAILQITPIDLGVTALVNPTVSNGCYGNAQNVTVTIKNMGSAPLNFQTNNATITVNVSGAVTQAIPFTLNNNTLNGGNPLAVSASLNVPVGTLNMSALGTYTFNASSSVAGDTVAANNAMSPVNIVVGPPVSGVASATPGSICLSGATTLNLAGKTGGNVQWQQGASATGAFTNITGATAAPFTTPTLTQTTYYRAIVSCGANSDTSNVVTVTVSNPQVTASAGATVCSGLPATLSATPSAGATITWYSAATGGSALATGNTYSPTVTANTTYYAQASVVGNGLTSLNAHPLTGGNGCTGGSMFNVNPISNITITGFDQNLNALSGTSVTVNIHYKTGSYLGSETTASAWTLHQAVTVTSAGPNAATFIPVNPLPLAGGQNYAFYVEADVSYTSITAPITYSNADLSIVVGAGLCGSFTSVNANRAWNGVIRYTASCAAPRVPVAVVVTPGIVAPAVTANGATTFCTGGSVVLSAVSSVTGATYQWYNNGVTITGATNATYTASAAGTYTAVVTANGCSSPASAATTITATTAPAIPTVTAGGTTAICPGSQVTLTASSTTTGVTYQWFNNGTAITGATSATYSANAAGTFTVTAVSNGCSSAASAVTTVTLNPIPATPTITRGGNSGQELTSSEATGNQWLLNGTAITGATAQTYQTTANGNYTVVVTNASGCTSDTSAVVNITNTGIKGAMAGMSVSVYPNPSKGKFNVKLVGYKQDAALELYSLTGQLIAKENVKAGQEITKVQVKNLAAGTYLLKVVSEKGVQINKLIVE
ncbi:T9SS type A sorting domain-containing protein [Adhaeribacter sp. BT258]|uniref:T9SS type A sorting domain-containing protein n=1 Tax=Adhaeribacter terrigena TaxID=2793070 RepID=A0ABS1BWZ3_9BACT|nr:T9SS type A sorting domain-containing protein [Adhaeribacter terrigena]MBK0401667.1 T9SS type A sorting domain-containing protein [Adhaeribacter terrigena]